jgi:hypothetical protein
MKKSNPNLFKIKEINAPLGSVSLYTNTKKDLLYAKASGYINLGLVKKDLSLSSLLTQHTPGPIWSIHQKLNLHIH